MKRFFLLLLLLLFSRSRAGSQAATVNPATNALLAPTAAQFFAASDSGSINAKRDFGAVGDNVADDTAALNAALLAACTQKKALYIPAGAYKITSAITFPPGDGSNFLGYGLVIYGDGSYLGGTKIQTTGDSTGGISCPHECDSIVIRDMWIEGTGASSTATGILLDGSVANSGSGGGNSIDGALFINLQVADFKTCISLNNVSDSTFDTLSVDAPAANSTSGFKLTGNDNSDQFYTCSVSGAAAWNIGNAGQIGISGGDQHTTANGNEFLINTSGIVQIRGVNIEHSGSGVAISLLAGKCEISSSLLANFGGTATYGIEVASGATLFLGPNVNFNSFTANAIKADATINCGIYSSIPNAYGIDIYNSGSKFDTASSGPWLTNAQADGATASASTLGRLMYRRNQGRADDSLTLGVELNGATYAFDNLDQYNSDVRAGIAPQTNTANTWTANQTIGSGSSLNVAGTLAVTGAANLSGGVTLNGALNAAGNLDVMGSTTLGGDHSSTTTTYGQRIQRGPNFGTDGDAQIRTVLMSGFTSGTASQELTLDGNSTVSGSNRLVLPANSSWAISMTLVARGYNTSTMANATKTFRRHFGVEYNGTISLVGSEVNDGGVFDRIFDPGIKDSVDVANHSVKITVTGLTNYDIRWLARLEITEISGASF